MLRQQTPLFFQRYPVFHLALKPIDDFLFCSFLAIQVAVVGDGTDIHRIKEGDTVEAKYRGGSKFYKAKVSERQKEELHQSDAA